MIEAPDAVREAVRSESLRGLDVPAGTQKSLPPWLFYDQAGSEFFEQITQLPEYYLTRTERAILAERADEIVGAAGCPMTVAELGAGTAAKTGLLLAAALRRQPEVLYQPIDVSPGPLERAAATLTADIPGLRVEPQVSNYVTNGYQIKRPEKHCIFALYIGSSIGNFGPEEARSILRKLRSRLSNKGGDAILLGVDLAPCVSKSVDVLLAAYNDAAGVTAAFNKNILARLNSEVGADFNLDCFVHSARWNPDESRIEMHLQSVLAQTVHIDGQAIQFAAGETIHTENSYKFTERSLRTLLHDSGFGSPQWFQDSQRWFGVALSFPF